MTLWPFQYVECFSAPYTRSFVAQRCSPAYCLFLLSVVALILVPIFVTFASDNVWVKESSYREQPVVTFGYGLLVVLSGESPNDAIGWGTLPDLDPLLPAQVRIPDVRSSAVDRNHDGIPDALTLTLEMPTGNASWGCRRVFLLAEYKVKLQAKVQEVLSGLVAIDSSSPYPASSLAVQGQLRLRQTMPLWVDTEVRRVYADSPLAVNWTSNWVASRQPLGIQALLESYAARNETAVLEQSLPPVWDYAPRDSVRLEVSIAVPPLLVQYVPRAPEVLKFAWMQLLAIAIPTWLVLQAIQGFAFKHQLVETYVVPQLPLKDGN